MKKVLSLGLVMFSTAVFAGGYAKFVDITVAGFEGNEIQDFPVLVKVSNAKLPGFYSAIHNAGKDVKFVSEDGAETYAYELDTWNPSGTSLYWVKIPTFKNGAKFRMYYGNVSVTNAPDCKAVWDENCLVVMHFNTNLVESAKGYTGRAFDSTASSLGGPCGYSCTISTGDESAKDGGVVLEGSEEMDHGAAFSVSYWAKHTTQAVSGDKEFVVQKRVGYYGTADKPLLGFSLTAIKASGNDRGYFFGYDSYFNGVGIGGNAINDEVWRNVVVTLDGTGIITYYVNGEFGNSVTTGPNNIKNNPDYPLVIGNEAVVSGGVITGVGAKDARSWKGAFDEVRVYKGAIDANRVSADYGTVNGDFCSFGAPQDDTSESTSALMIF